MKTVLQREYIDDHAQIDIWAKDKGWSHADEIHAFVLMAKSVQYQRQYERACKIIGIKESKERCVVKHEKPLIVKTRHRHLYIIRAPGNRFKIGIAYNVRLRLVGLQIGCPVKLKIQFKEEMACAEDCESMLLSKYINYKLHGEWIYLKSNYDLSNLLLEIKNWRCFNPECLRCKQLK